MLESNVARPFLYIFFHFFARLSAKSLNKCLGFRYNTHHQELCLRNGAFKVFSSVFFVVVGNYIAYSITASKRRNHIYTYIVHKHNTYRLYCLYIGIFIKCHVGVNTTYICLTSFKYNFSIIYRILIYIRRSYYCFAYYGSDIID